VKTIYPSFKAALARVVAILSLCAPLAHAEFSRAYLDQQTLQTAAANGIDIAYRSVGADNRPTVVMIMGLGASHIVWGDNMVKGLEQAGYRVLLLDNRDVGGSTRFDEWGQPTLWWQLLKNQLGFDVDAPYTLNDMAADTIALMDLLELEDAHVVGASMGGMIAQVIAARYPQRTRTLVSIMSSTGAPHLPPPTAEASDRLRGLASDDDSAAERKQEFIERGFYPEAMPRQMMAIFKTGDRSVEVAGISVPTLVLHGADDTLLPPPHGEHTAELIAGSDIVIFEEMGHNIPDPVLPLVLEQMIEHMRRNDAPAQVVATQQHSRQLQVAP
jgi:pimeloyl-ACP methyl ester carboxylesterase